MSSFEARMVLISAPDDSVYIPEEVFMANQDASPVTVLRPDDLLLLRFHFHGLRLQHQAAGQPWLLVKNPPDQPKPLIIVEFPPQSIGEEAFFEKVDGVSLPTDQPPPDPPDPANSEDLRPPPVNAYLSGPTWLVFNVANTVPVTYTLPGLLAACVGGYLNVSIERRPPADALIRLATLLAQGRLFTRIEAPYHLVRSPESGTTWQGRALPKSNEADTRVELWHATMLKSKSNRVPGGTVRAVWTTDFWPWPDSPPLHTNDPFRMPLDSRDRYELVRLSTEKAPIQAEQLILSTVGAWLKVAGAWQPPPDLSVTEWKHLMTMGRDHFVRVVYQGYLLPFGHEASLVKITERKIEPVDGKRVAYLRTRMFVVVRQPTRDYDYNGSPFRQVTLKTLVTPGIDPPEQGQIANLSQDAFWVQSGGSDVLFHIVARDHENREIEFTTPLAFVSNDKASSSQANTIVSKAWTASTDPRRKCTLGGQAVAFAPPVQPNDTTLETTSISLGAKYNAAATPRFLPTVTEAEVDIPAVKQLLGTSAPSTIIYHDKFLGASAGQFGNPAEVFAKVTSPPPTAQFKTDQAGGLVKPDFAIEGLSRSLGPVPRVDDLVAGTFDPEKVFPDIVLLGGINLSQIVNEVDFDASPPDGELVPRLVTTVENGVAVACYRWHLKKDEADTYDANGTLVGHGALIGNGMFVPDWGAKGAELEIVSEVRRPLDGSPGSFLSTGRLTRFHLVLLPSVAELVNLYFDEIAFTARSGQKTDVRVVLKSITFLGKLAFVNALMQVVPLDGFSDPPHLNIDANGVGLGYTLAIPSVGIGVFSLQNLSLSAGFYLPFIDSPANVQLAFCTRENPGQVLVSLFGGGVFFAITLSTLGVQGVEMAMEFGAGISLNVGVASGSVTVMGGVYYQKSGAEVLFSAYIRMVGKVSVLGLISIGVEFYLALEYYPSPDDKLFGVAALKVKVKVAFFSKTVTLEVRREFKGTDPTFRDVLAPPDWQAYCEAFGD
jgi:hypothetical protein